MPVSCDYLSLKWVFARFSGPCVMSASCSTTSLKPLDWLTMYDGRRRIDRQVHQALVDRFGGAWHLRYGRRLVSPRRRPRAKTIFEDAPTSRGAEDYRQLVRWVSKRSWRAHDVG